MNCVTTSWHVAAATIHERFKFMSFWLQNYHEFELCPDELS